MNVLLFTCCKVRPSRCGVESPTMLGLRVFKSWPFNKICHGLEHGTLGAFAGPIVGLKFNGDRELVVWDYVRGLRSRGFQKKVSLSYVFSVLRCFVLAGSGLGSFELRRAPTFVRGL